jgi:hypothetical protein
MLNGYMRKNAEKYGLVVHLCRKCHNEVHFGKRSKELMEKLKKEAQLRFQIEHPDLDFLKIFHRNYLDDGEAVSYTIDTELPF